MSKVYATFTTTLSDLLPHHANMLKCVHQPVAEPEVLRLRFTKNEKNHIL
jgi:hypothetical protein